jgi:hypothetical protein
MGKTVLKSSSIKRWTGIPGAVTNILYSTLGFVPFAEQSTWITINGIKQHDSSYTLDSTKINFTDGIVNFTLDVLDEVEVVSILDVGMPLVPSDNSIKVEHFSTADGLDGQVLTTDGAGNLSFTSSGSIDLDGGDSGTVYSSVDVIIDCGGA